MEYSRKEIDLGPKAKEKKGATDLQELYKESWRKERRDPKI